MRKISCGAASHSSCRRSLLDVVVQHLPDAAGDRLGGDVGHVDMRRRVLEAGLQVGGERLQRALADLDRLGAGAERVDERQVRVRGL